MRTSSFLHIAPLVAVLSACGNLKTEPGATCPQAMEPVTYTAHIAPLMRDWCEDCHSGSRSNANVVLDTYENVRKNSDAANLDIMSGRMPVGGTLSEEQRCLFDGWVEGGYIE